MDYHKYWGTYLEIILASNEISRADLKFCGTSESFELLKLVGRSNLRAQWSKSSVFFCMSFKGKFFQVKI
jgi:hypothetical protein